MKSKMCMDTLNLKDGQEEEVVGGAVREERMELVGGVMREERIESVGSGIETPVKSKKRRRNTIGGSPEEVFEIRSGVEGEKEGLQDLLKRNVMESVAEMREYVRNDFNKANKECRTRYFEKRLDLIEESSLMMDVECRRARGMADKVGSIERNFRRLIEKDYGTELNKVIEAEVSRALDRMADYARSVIDESVGMMARKVEEVITAHQQAEEDREKAAEVEEGRRRKKMESIMGSVEGLERRLVAVERFFEEVRSNMDRTYEEVQQVGKRVKDDLRGIVEVERRTEGTVSKLAESLDVERINIGVAEAKKTMEEVVGVMGAVRRLDKMEVDEDVESFAQVTRRRRKKGPSVVLEGPGGEGREITREQVVKCLDPKKGEVRVRGLRRMGKDFVIEVHGEDDVERLRGNVALGEIGVKVDGAPKLRWPRIYVHDVDREIEREELVEAVMRRNGLHLGLTDLEKVRQEFIPEFIRGRRDSPVRSWVVRVSPEVFKKLMRVERLYVGVRSCRVVEFSSVSRCYKCQGLGHVKKYCKNQECCGYCAGQHDEARCERKQKQEEPTCVNCKRLGVREKAHPAFWNECPALTVYRRRMENMTDYGS